MPYKWNNIVIPVLIMTITAVIVGVGWTAFTGRSGQRVYLWSALIGMCMYLFMRYALAMYMYVIYLNDTVLGAIQNSPPWVMLLIIVLAIGFFITGMISPSSGNNTDSLPYLISAVVSVAITAFVVIGLHYVLK